MNEPTAQMVFGRTDSPSQTLASAFDDGQVTITVQNTEVGGHACDNELSLGQVIQLRDFLNRHIDSLAIQQTGSLAVRASDDPAQMAAEELVIMRREGTLPDNPALSLDEMERIIGTVPTFASDMPVAPYSAERYRKD